MPSRRIIHGIATSPGLAQGGVHVVRANMGEVPTWTVSGDEIEREVERLQRALVAAGEEMARRQRVVAAQSGENDAQIFAVHALILKDPAALKEVVGNVRTQRINAEAAVQCLIRRLESTVSNMEGNSVRSYAADLADPWLSVLDSLRASGSQEIRSGGEQVVLAAAELTPHVMTFLARERLLAVIAERGGRFSHAAVLARSFGVPCVVGLPGLLTRLEQGMQVLVDGSRGSVQLRPEPDDVGRFMARKQRMEERHAEFEAEAHLPSVTPDGVELKVLVNVESLRDLEMFDPSRTDGLGLLRTEFLYMERPQFPSEDEQFRLYRSALERMGDLPVTLRTLDIGGDKKLPYFQTPDEPNPALGWRGLRISLEWRDLLRIQLRALLRAGSGHDMRILLPMVTSLEEVRQVHGVFDEVRASLSDQGYEVEDAVSVGIMIEVPSALFCIEELLREVDFVSVGTNDLVQYLLAADRDNPKVGSLYDPHHPAVLRALDLVARAARAAGKPCSVCGDVADDPAYALLLLGLGYDAVSVAPGFHAEVKYAVRHTPAESARAFALEALACEDRVGVRAVLDSARDQLHAEN